MLSPNWQIREAALFYLREKPTEISAAGRDHLVELLGREVDRTIPPPTPGMIDDEESYGGYLADLTNLVARFNDPRAASVFVRGGIAYSMGARFQVAVAGDPAVDGLVQTWTSAPQIRPGVISTFGFMLQYADSTGRALTPAHRATAQAYLLRAAADSAPWVRAAFVDAATTVGDPAYVGALQFIIVHDSAMIDGQRYVAAAASEAATHLAQHQAAATPAQLVRSLGEQAQAACLAGWIAPDGACQSLVAKIGVAAEALDRGDVSAARGQIDALRAELTAQRGQHLNEIGFAMLDSDAAYIVIRLGSP